MSILFESAGGGEVAAVEEDGARGVGGDVGAVEGVLGVCMGQGEKTRTKEGRDGTGRDGKGFT